MQFLSLVIGTVLLVLTTPIWGSALWFVFQAGLFLALNYFWVFVILFIGMCVVAVKHKGN